MNKQFSVTLAKTYGSFIVAGVVVGYNMFVPLIGLENRGILMNGSQSIAHFCAH